MPFSHPLSQSQGRHYDFTVCMIVLYVCCKPKVFQQTSDLHTIFFGRYQVIITFKGHWGQRSKVYCLTPKVSYQISSDLHIFFLWETIAFWGYEDKDQDYSRLKWPWKKIPCRSSEVSYLTSSIQRFLLNLFGFWDPKLRSQLLIDFEKTCLLVWLVKLYIKLQ